MYRYVAEYPSGRREQVLSEEHMLYTWEAAESLGVDEKHLKKELENVCGGKPEYYYVTSKGKLLRCYFIKDIVEAAVRLRQAEKCT